MKLRSVLDLLAPPLCAGCGAGAGEAEPLCGRCRRELRWLGREAVPIGGERLCEAWAPVAYEGGARGLVRALKFKGAVGAAGAMAAAMAAGAPDGWFGGVGAVVELVPVPLHPKRARRRGYNQAERLAGALGGRVGLGVSDCLVRTGARGTQVGRDRAQRLSGIAGTVALAAGRSPPRRAILVDDVITTGATLAACARALRDGGAEEVRAVAYARTPGR